MRNLDDPLPAYDAMFQMGTILAVLAIAAVDVFVPFNLATLYYVPLAASAWFRPRTSLWRLVILASILSLIAPFVKPFTVQVDWTYTYVGIINRSFLIVGLCTVTILLHDFRQPRLSYAIDGLNDDIDSLLTLGWLLIAVIFTGLVAAIDLVLPSYINPACLYPIPLLLIVSSGNRRLIPIATALLLMLLVLGYLSGYRDISSDLQQAAIKGRFVAATVLVLLCVLFRNTLFARPTDR